MMLDKTPYDPKDAHDILCEAVRTNILSVAGDAIAKTNVFDTSSDGDKLSALMVGTMTAAACILLASYKERNRKTLLKIMAQLSQDAIDMALAIEKDPTPTGTA